MPEVTSHKRCSKCKQTKPAEKFSPDRRKESGFQSQCKECKNSWHRQRYRSPLFDYPAHCVSVKKYLSTERAKKTRQKYCNQLPRLVRKATTALGHAVERGKILKPETCSLCGVKPRRIDAHHHKGYEQKFWLDVIWVCRHCHRKIEARQNLHEAVRVQVSSTAPY